jgi:SAM-dependent methyltransferase
MISIEEYSLAPFRALVHMDPLQQLKDILSNAIADGAFQRAVFSRPRQNKQEFRRIDVRAIELRGQTWFQFARRSATQEFHANLNAVDAIAEMGRLSTSGFRDIWVCTSEEEFQFRTNRRHESTVKHKPAAAARSTTPDSHDRTPQYLIPDGVPCPFLQHVGVMDRQGNVRQKSRGKFRQINHYLNLIRTSVDALPKDGCINVVDFGCGKSYLTFATHHLLRNILNRDCRVIGLDLRQDVVRTCTEVVKSLSLADLSFFVGDIQSWEPDCDVHMTISLHACDTATDDALFKAIQWGTSVILAVPCCQHELAQRLANNTAGNPLLTGVLLDRFAAMATDAMRIFGLKSAGYRADIIEFIDTDHTPKNLMIRAIRRTDVRQGSNSSASRSELLEFRDKFQLPAGKLERLLLDSESSKT